MMRQGNVLPHCHQTFARWFLTLCQHNVHQLHHRKMFDCTWHCTPTPRRAHTHALYLAKLTCQCLLDCSASRFPVRQTQTPPPSPPPMKSMARIITNYNNGYSLCPLIVTIIILIIHRSIISSPFCLALETRFYSDWLIRRHWKIVMMMMVVVVIMDGVVLPSFMFQLSDFCGIIQ